MYALPLLVLLSIPGVARDGYVSPPLQAAQSPSPTNKIVDTVSTAGPTVRELRSGIERLLDRGGWEGADWSVMAASLDGGDVLFSHAAGRELAPASNMKLFTTAAALHFIGPDYRFKTYLLTTGEIRDSVLVGDLIIYGTGDPTLSGRYYRAETPIWEQFAAALERLGIQRVRGDIVGDASYFNGRATGVGWEADYMDARYAAPASALAYNDNVVTLYIRPGDQVGWRPRVQFIPDGRRIAVVNQAVTSAGGGQGIRVDRASYDGPIVIRGEIARGHSGIWRAVPVGDPARYSVAVFAAVLADHGIPVTGRARSVHERSGSAVTGRMIFGESEDGMARPRVLDVHRSPPLLEILRVINMESHNFSAEMMLRTAGRFAIGDGSIRGGAAAVRTLIENGAGIVPDSLRILDGSGLSSLNRVSARTVVALLAYMARSPTARAFHSTLPVAGTSDGLRRMYRTAAADNLHAKTGTIDGVSALSGYVRAANGELIAFSIISNNVPSEWRAKRIEDAIGARLAAFSRPRPQPASGRMRLDSTNASASFRSRPRSPAMSLTSTPPLVSAE